MLILNLFKGKVQLISYSTGPTQAYCLLAQVGVHHLTPSSSSIHTLRIGTATLFPRLQPRNVLLICTCAGCISNASWTNRNFRKMSPLPQSHLQAQLQTPRQHNHFVCTFAFSVAIYVAEHDPIRHPSSYEDKENVRESIFFSKTSFLANCGRFDTGELLSLTIPPEYSPRTCGNGDVDWASSPETGATTQNDPTQPLPRTQECRTPSITSSDPRPVNVPDLLIRRRASMSASPHDILPPSASSSTGFDGRSALRHAADTRAADQDPT